VTSNPEAVRRWKFLTGDMSSTGLSLSTGLSSQREKP
jgi:hypothetical protein